MVEAAILSVPLIKVRILTEGKRKGAKDLLELKKNIHSAIATIVIINNAVNIIGAIFVGRMVTGLFGSNWLGIASAVFTFAIIIISEVIPKTIGEHYRITISLASAKPLRVIMFVVKPVVSAIVLVAASFKRESTFPKVTEEEIKMMLKLGSKEGTVELDEEALCSRVFKLNDLKASQMMRTIDGVYGLPHDRRLLEVKDAIINSPYSRLIVYEKDPVRIIGSCQQRVLLRELSKYNYSATVKDFMTAPIFVTENERADSLLEKFQAYHQHLFIVRNERGKNIGIVTMEDVLEELFGEIYDEKDFARQKTTG
jgi:CBS domain containing-hemolysin-like protein